MVSYPTIISSFVLRYYWLWSDSLLHVEGLLYDPIMLLKFERTYTSESMNPMGYHVPLDVCFDDQLAGSAHEPTHRGWHTFS